MNEINPQVQDIITQKKVSPRKIRNLIFLKSFVDRVANRPYLPKSEIEKLKQKFGAEPDIQTWGDYFQAEIAGSHWDATDAAFEQVTQTIVFDIIAAIMIFSGKQDDFIRMVELNYEAALQVHEQMKEEGMTFEDEENFHMGILLNYFKEMGLSMASLSDEDFQFFEQFAVTSKVG